MHKRGLPEDSVTSKGLAIAASLALHVLLLIALFVVWPSWYQPQTLPVVNVHLVQLPREPVEKKPPKPVNVPEQKKTQSAASRKIAIEKQKRAEALAIKKAAERKRALERQKREAWLKKQAELKEQARIKALKEKKAKEEEARRKQEELAQKQLQQLASEQLRQIQAQNAAKKQAELTKTQKLVAQYEAIIRHKISMNWHYPLDTTKQMKTSVKLTLAPTGEIINLVLVTSSGNMSFDQSVLQAIRAAAPFDVLNKLSIRVFETYFRTLTLKFTPQDLME